ncbi:hypothetical protein ACFWAN_32540 [Streptomyces mirabilis]|uniref:hypothetical protein n=1 Tax=Streptomyces mirabilis TaxID=68239 RepID=UPI0036477D8E
MELVKSAGPMGSVESVVLLSFLFLIYVSMKYHALNWMTEAGGDYSDRLLSKSSALWPALHTDFSPFPGISWRRPG